MHIHSTLVIDNDTDDDDNNNNNNNKELFRTSVDITL